MGVFINIMFFIISFVTLIISSGFLSNSAVRVTQIPQWDKNPNLKSAHDNLTVAAIVGWVTVAVMVVLIVLYLIFGLETAEVPGIVNILTYIFLFGTLAALAVVGILSAMAAAKIGNAKVSDDKGSRRQAIIAAVLAIVGFVGMTIVLLVRFFYKPSKKGKDSGKTKEKEMILLQEIKKEDVKEKKQKKIESIIESKLESNPKINSNLEPTTSTGLDYLLKLKESGYEDPYGLLNHPTTDKILNHPSTRKLYDAFMKLRK